jgi:hypothetical protein
MVHTQHHKVQRKEQHGKGKKEQGKLDNGKYSNQVLETMDPDRLKEGRGEKHKKTARMPKEEGRTKNPGRKEGTGTSRKKNEEGKMAGKARKRKKGHTPRKSPALTQFPRLELTAIPSTLGRASTPTPEVKMEGKEVEIWTVVPHDPHMDWGRVWSPTIRAWIAGDLSAGRAMYSRYANEDPTWNPTPPL